MNFIDRVTGSTNQAEISSIIILDFLATFSSFNLSIAYYLFNWPEQIYYKAILFL